MNDTAQQWSKRRHIGPSMTRSLPGTPSAVREARRWTGEIFSSVLHADPDAIECAELLVSEAATNAIGHTLTGRTGGSFAIHVYPRGDHARVEVHDAGGTTTAPRSLRAGPDQEHGRGVSLIEAMSQEWGILGAPGSRLRGVFFIVGTR